MSRGTNSPKLIAPAAAGSTEQSIQAYRPSHIIRPEQLRDALSWKKKTPSIFTFFTPSLLFAVVAASRRKYDGEDNVRIICFDATRATTVDGGKVEFRSAQDMVNELAITTSRANGDPRDYSDVIIATTCIRPGGDVRVAGFDKLEAQGLYQLYPSLESNKFERKPRFNFLIEHTRGFGWEKERPLSPPKIGVAARLAAAFEEHGRGGASPLSIEPQLLAHILALQKRCVSDEALACWLERYSDEVVSLDDDIEVRSGSETRSCLPEVAQQQDLMKPLGNRHILATALASDNAISVYDVNFEALEFQEWKSADRAQYRAVNPRHDARVSDRGRKRKRREGGDDQVQKHHSLYDNTRAQTQYARAARDSREYRLADHRRYADRRWRRHVRDGETARV